jgi:rhodanese-related sulfurtransferase
MSCRGVLFALTEEQAAAVQSAEEDAALMAIIEAVEQDWDSDHLAECDKSWDALHRAITDGSLEWESGDYPLNQVILGSPSLHKGPSYIVCFKNAQCVRDIAGALQEIDQSLVKEMYLSKVPHDYAPEYGDDDCAYTCEYYGGIREFYLQAAKEGRAVIFTVDQ